MTKASSRITIDTPIAFRDELPEEVDAVIIGGGVIGVFTALYLARMGKRILVCEKGRIAGEQSSRNWGWIRQHGRDRAELPIMMDAMNLWLEVNRETGGSCGVVTGGTYFLATNQSELDEYESWLSIARDHGLKSTMLSAKEVSGLFMDAAGNSWVGAVGTPSDACGEPWAAVPAVARLAQEAGAAICKDCAVRSLDLAAGALRGVITEHGRVACEQVVLAGGAWSSLFARLHGIDIPQLALRATVAQTETLPEFVSGNFCDEQLAFRRRADGGYTLALADRHGFFPGPDALRHLKTYLPVLRRVWKETDPHFFAPKGFPDGWRTPRSWSEEDVSPFEAVRVLEPLPNGSYANRMAERFAGRFPNIGRPRFLNTWGGMIDAMPDIVPIVDRVPGTDNLIIATGMSGHGFGIGPGFGRAVARMVAVQAPEHDLSRFRFGRFRDGSPLELGPSI